MSTVDIASYNLRGLQTELKRRKVFNYFHEKKHDIVLVQETHSARKNEKIWRNEWGGDIIFSHYNSRSRGVAVLIRKGLSIRINKLVKSIDGRFIIMEIEIDDLAFVLINVYAPNEDHPEFFVKLFEETSKFENPYKLYGGDFNLVLDLDKDRVGTGPDAKDKSRKVVHEHIKNEDLVDIWRTEHPDSTRFTWMRKNPAFSGSRLDYWLMSNCFSQFMEKTDIPAAVLSDHAPITIKILPSVNKRGKGVWMINNSLLQDDQYVNLINQVIDQTIQIHHGEDISLIWEVVKMNIRGETIKYSTMKRKMRDNKIEALEKKLHDVESAMGESSALFYNDNEKWEQMRQIKADIEDIQSNKTKAAMIRSKATYFEYGEKMSSYFFNLEKFNQKR